MQFCYVCGSPVYEEDYYEEHGMYICPDCFSALEPSALEEELIWLDERG